MSSTISAVPSPTGLPEPTVGYDTRLFSIYTHVHFCLGGRALLVVVALHRLRAANHLAMDVLLPTNQAYPGGPRNNYLYFCWYDRRTSRSSRTGNFDQGDVGEG